MTSDYNLCLHNLRALIAEYLTGESGYRNEATTRLQLIDELLFGCLGWEKQDCSVEDTYNGTYVDYSLGTPQVHLIVEAKRENIHFELPIGYSRLTYSIHRFKTEASDVYKAIEQAMAYCQARGVPFGAVFNGHQVVAFLASRLDGVPPLRGKALVLESLPMMVKHFQMFWNCLSQPGVMSRGLPNLLLESDQLPPPDKLSVRIPNYPRYQNRNLIQTNLNIFGELIIEDVATDPDNEAKFLQACYAESGALSQYALVSKAILKSKYSAKFQESLEGPTLVPATEKGGKPSITSEMLAQSTTKRPVLLIGDVGVGKTMFVRHFIGVEAVDLLRNEIVLYLDLGIKPTLGTDLDEYLADEITRQLLDDYEIDIADDRFVRGVHNLALARFRKGIYGRLRQTDPATYRSHEIEFLDGLISNRSEHLRQSLEHINRGRSKQIVIFLDNVDQRPDEFQQRAFLVGQSMAELWPALVFVSLRPETYHRSRLAGALSAYHAKAFTISPPRVDRVINKRLQYAIQLLDSGSIGRSMEYVGIDVDLGDLLDYLKIIDYSFQSNVELVEFVDNVCGGNIRLALDFVKVLVGTGHVNTEKVLRIYRTSGRYRVPLHELLRAVIYGDYRDYDPRFSEIVNLFDINGVDGGEHFLAPTILAYIELGGQNSESGGYVPIERLYEYIQRAGFHPKHSRLVVRKLHRKKLIETTAKIGVRDDNGSVESHYRITTIGSYYYRKMIGMFQYVDAMVPDTPVVDREARARIRDIAHIEGRLERALEFRSYLDRQWERVEAASEVFDWMPVSQLLTADIERIRQRVISTHV